MAAFGYAIFGVGVEVAGITVSKVIVKWFTGHELALAMVFNLRLPFGNSVGSFNFASDCKSFRNCFNAGFNLSLNALYRSACIFVYTFNDKRLEKSISDAKLNSDKVADEEKNLKSVILVRLLRIKLVVYFHSVLPILFSRISVFEIRYGTYDK